MRSFHRLGEAPWESWNVAGEPATSASDIVTVEKRSCASLRRRSAIGSSARQAHGCASRRSMAGTERCTSSRPRHHPDFRKDGKERMTKVAAATGAAPTYYKPLQDGGYTFVDGGVWANNPVMIALVDALTCFVVPRENISILSLGCGDEPYSVGNFKMMGGGLFAWWDIIHAAMRLQSQNALGQAGLLVGADRVTRVDAPALDDQIRFGRLVPRLERTARCRQLGSDGKRRTRGSDVSLRGCCSLHARDGRTTGMLKRLCSDGFVTVRVERTRPDRPAIQAFLKRYASEGRRLRKRLARLDRNDSRPLSLVWFPVRPPSSALPVARRCGLSRAYRPAVAPTPSRGTRRGAISTSTGRQPHGSDADVRSSCVRAGPPSRAVPSSFCTAAAYLPAASRSPDCPSHIPSR